MSHFFVLVAGENVEGQLDPYWELNLNHDQMFEDPRAVFVDKTEELMDKWQNGTTDSYSYRNIHKDRIIGDVVSNPDLTITLSYKNIFHNLKKGNKIRIVAEKQDNDIFASITDIKSITRIIDATKPDSAENKEEYDRITAVIIDAPKKIGYKKEYATIEEFADGYYGYHKNSDGRYGYYHNPKAKWDWYLTGGRFTGSLKLKEKTDIDYDKIDLFGFDINDIKKIIELLKTGPQPENEYLSSWKKACEKFSKDLENVKNEILAKHAASLRKDDVAGKLESAVKNVIGAMYPAHKISNYTGVFDGYCNLGYADVCLKRDVDIEGMQGPADKYARIWEQWHKTEMSAEFFEIMGEDFKFDCYPGKNGTPELSKKLSKWIDDNLGGWHSIKDIQKLQTMKKEDYIECQTAWTPFALLWDGKWYERAEMGWFGMAYNHEPQWNGEFKQLWESIPEDETLTVVDCHI